MVSIQFCWNFSIHLYSLCLARERARERRLFIIIEIIQAIQDLSFISSKVEIVFRLILYPKKTCQNICWQNLRPNCIEKRQRIILSFCSVCVYGQGDKRIQISKIKAKAEIVVATPGRLNDFTSSGKIKVAIVFRIYYLSVYIYLYLKMPHPIWRHPCMGWL